MTSWTPWYMPPPHRERCRSPNDEFFRMRSLTPSRVLNTMTSTPSKDATTWLKSRKVLVKFRSARPNTIVGRSLTGLKPAAKVPPRPTVGPSYSSLRSNFGPRVRKIGSIAGRNVNVGLPVHVAAYRVQVQEREDPSVKASGPCCFLYFDIGDSNKAADIQQPATLPPKRQLRQVEVLFVRDRRCPRRPAGAATQSRARGPPFRPRWATRTSAIPPFRLPTRARRSTCHRPIERWPRQALARQVATTKMPERTGID